MGTSRSLFTVTNGRPGAESRPAASVDQLIQALVGLDLSGLAEEGPVHAALIGTVAAGRYWQYPDGEDVLAGDPRVRAVMRPVTEHGLGSEQVRHWAHPRAGSQWVIDWWVIAWWVIAWWVREGRSPLLQDPRGVLEAGARVEQLEEACRPHGEPVRDLVVDPGGHRRRCPRGRISSETIPGRGRPP